MAAVIPIRICAPGAGTDHRGHEWSTPPPCELLLHTPSTIVFGFPGRSHTVLDSIRKNASDSFVLKVLFAIIALVFVFFYVGTASFSQLEVAALVNEERVTKKEFDRALQNLDRFYRNASPNNAPSVAQLQSQALDQLVNTTLLVQEATNLGLEVGDQELRDSIAAIPDFQIDGRFNKTRYIEALTANRLKPSDFEEIQQRQLLTDKLLELVRAGVHVSDGEISQRFNFENGRIKLKLLRVPRDSFAEAVTVDEASLETYFNENKETFREPERTAIDYLAFRPEIFESQVQPTEEDLQVYYDGHTAEYDVKEQVRARHILFRVNPTATDEEKQAIREKAVDVRKRALDGEDFAELAKAHSEDSTASLGGDLGPFGRGIMAAPFEEAAFSLEPGTISDLVETQFGIHIIKTEEKIAARKKTLEEVRDEIRQKVQKRESRKVTLVKVEEAFEKLLDGDSFEAISEAYGVEVKTTAPFGRGEVIPLLGRQPKIAEAAFATDKGDIGEIMNLDSGYLIFKVADRIASRIPARGDIEAKVEGAYRDARASEAAKQQAESLLARIKAGEKIDDVASSEGIEITETGEVGRFGAYIPNLGSVQALKDDAFNLTESQPIAPAVYEFNGDAVIAVLAEQVSAPADRLEQDKERLVQRLRAQKEGEVVRKFIDDLRSASEIEIGQGYDFTQADS